MRILLWAAAILVEAAALAQVRIISFDPSGELIWTNSIWRGFYAVESAASPVGPWNSLATVADLDSSKTNSLTFPVTLSNAHAFYRVGWIPPNPIGIWDYSGYDTQGALVITGRLSIASMTLLSSNPPIVYSVQGTRNLEYNGAPTNAPWWLGPQFGMFGTGPITGTVEFHTAALRLRWPTNYIDFNIQLIGTVGPHSSTGTWNYYTFAGPSAGPFNAKRTP